MKLHNSLCEKLYLQPAEFLMLFVGLAAGIIDIALVIYKGSRIDVPGYAGLLLLILLVIPLGLFYRIRACLCRVDSVSFRARI